MYENGLGKVISGLETAPAAPEEDATQGRRAQHALYSRWFDDNKTVSCLLE